MRLVLAIAVGVLIGWLLGFLVITAVASAQVHTSRPGVRMLERFEGYEPMPAPDPIGVPTVCYGTTTADVRPLPAFATPAQCERILIRELARKYEPPVRALFSRRGWLRGLFNQHRFDALVSASYNLGPGLVTCMLRAMCEAIRSRAARRIANTLLLYDRAGGGVLPGLYLRRQAEALLFMTPMGRFELFPRSEVHLLLAFDTQRLSLARRARLRAAIRLAADGIARTARREHDWLTLRRLTRYRAFERRLRLPA